MWLRTANKSLVRYIKYKIVYSDDKDPKKGISQNDLYQMLAYAVRFEVDEIILFYPNTLKQDQEENTQMIIKDALANGKEITIKAFQLPIINRMIFEEEYNPKLKLGELFSNVRLNLINRLDLILK